MCTSSLSQREDLPEAYSNEGSAESRPGCMSLLKIYRGLLAGCCTTKIRHPTAASGGNRDRLQGMVSTKYSAMVCAEM